MLDDIISTSDCPFAEETMADGRVKIVEGDRQTLMQEVAMWDDRYEVIVLIPVRFRKYYDWCIALEPELAQVDLIAIANQKQGYILLQRLSDLVNASNTLVSSGFYDAYTSEQISHVLRRRRLAEEWPRL
jgi:hypothetical protein